MKTRNGKEIHNGMKVILSANIVKSCHLPSNRGEIVDCRSNPEQLVSVRVGYTNTVYDFHVKSLTTE
jgi:hypothetical protein